MLFALEPVNRPSPQGMKVKAGGSPPGNRQPPGNADPEGVEPIAIFRHGANRYDPFRVAAEWRWAWLPGAMPPATLSIPFGDSLLRFVTGMVPLAQSEQYWALGPEVACQCPQRLKPGLSPFIFGMAEAMP